jgi:hypothetical protein
VSCGTLDLNNGGKIMNLFEGYPQFKLNRDQTFYFMKDSVKGSLIKAWLVKDGNTATLHLVDLLKTLIEIDVLKGIGLWDLLDVATQGAITEVNTLKTTVVKDKMAEMRGKRKKKFDFSKLPEFLTCKCGREVKANYYSLQKKADKQMIPLDDLVKSYQCQTCNPTKGRKKKS